MRTEPCRADSPSTTQNPTTFWPRKRTRCCRNIRCSTTPRKKPQPPNRPLEPEDNLLSLSSGKETRPGRDDPDDHPTPSSIDAVADATTMDLPVVQQEASPSQGQPLVQQRPDDEVPRPPPSSPTNPSGMR
ncbi:hypothetical protein BHE74_00049132 [Ensete ventricosum]|nr:hypothetical protein BHE74_00049132 [Ensete ventricosum]RZS22206.1 hypothetical protein BHM03_00054950 [Ensete ventricosum]